MSDRQIIVTLNVPFERIVDLLTTGIEGGFSTWLHGINYDVEPEAEYEDFVRYAQPIFWESGGVITFSFDADGDEEGEGTGRKQVKEQDLVDAIAKLPPRQMADWLDENDDAITGDSFLQLLCLGEVIYG